MGRLVSHGHLGKGWPMSHPKGGQRWRRPEVAPATSRATLKARGGSKGHPPPSSVATLVFFIFKKKVNLIFFYFYIYYKYFFGKNYFLYNFLKGSDRLNNDNITFSKVMCK